MIAQPLLWCGLGLFVTLLSPINGLRAESLPSHLDFVAHAVPAAITPQGCKAKTDFADEAEKICKTFVHVLRDVSKNLPPVDAKTSCGALAQISDGIHSDAAKPDYASEEESGSPHSLPVKVDPIFVVSEETDEDQDDPELKVDGDINVPDRAFVGQIKSSDSNEQSQFIHKESGPVYKGGDSQFYRPSAKGDLHARSARTEAESGPVYKGGDSQFYRSSDSNEHQSQSLNQGAEPGPIHDSPVLNSLVKEGEEGDSHVYVRDSYESNREDQADQAIHVPNQLFIGPPKSLDEDEHDQQLVRGDYHAFATGSSLFGVKVKVAATGFLGEREPDNKLIPKVQYSHRKE